ncbi:hypothetical protein MRX96_051370 [Rhipicephalus microplus]
MRKTMDMTLDSSLIQDSALGGCGDAVFVVYTADFFSAAAVVVACPRSKTHFFCKQGLLLLGFPRRQWPPWIIVHVCTHSSQGIEVLDPCAACCACAYCTPPSTRTSFGSSSCGGMSPF